MNTSVKAAFTTRQLALTGLMTAVICILGPISIAIPISPVPVSLGMLGIYFVLCVLGRRLGTISVVIYELLGLAGVPVFTGFTGGVGKLFGPTGGYLIGYLFMALICGYFLDHWKQNIPMQLLGMVCGTIVCYLFGTSWLAYQASMTFPAALAAGVLPFLPADCLKLALAMVIGTQLRKRLNKAGLL